jgi:hypothetical protein
VAVKVAAAGVLPSGTNAVNKALSIKIYGNMMLRIT